MTFYDDDDYRIEEDAPKLTYASLAFRSVNDQAILMLVDFEPDQPMQEYRKPGVLATRADGTPRTQHVITAMVMPNTTAVIPGRTVGNTKAPDTPAQVGQFVRLYVSGTNKWDPERQDCFGAVKAAHGEFTVGDLLMARLVGESFVGVNGTQLNQPKKIMAYAIQPRRPEDQAQAAVAMAERRKIKAFKATQAGQVRPVQAQPEPERFTGIPPYQPPAQPAVAQPAPVQWSTPAHAGAPSLPPPPAEPTPAWPPPAAAAPAPAELW